MITAIVIGAGDRGRIYSDYQFKHPDKLKIVGIAEINQLKRNKFVSKYNLDDKYVFSSWEMVFELDKFADAVFITTPDNLHLKPALMAIEKGYHVLLEKPMAPRFEQVVQIVKAYRDTETVVQVCHELRFTNFYRKIYDTIQTGILGEIINISMQENVSYYHYAHSFIRGNWNNRENSAPMILAKCSHDMDLLYWFASSPPSRISSFGGLKYFKKYNSEQLADRCTDGCIEEDMCLYYAPRLYEEIIPILHILNKSDNITDRIVSGMVLKKPAIKRIPPFNKVNEYNGWPVSILTEDSNMSVRREALKSGPYGRCVYKVEEHDVVDHQVVSIEFVNNITATLTMHGHSSEEGRYIRIDGTRGTIEGTFKTSRIFLQFTDSLSNKKEIIFDEYLGGGHGGGDHRIVDDFISNIESRKKGDNTKVLTDVKQSFVSHAMAFAADEARLNGKIIDMREYLEYR